MKDDWNPGFQRKKKRNRPSQQPEKRRRYYFWPIAIIIIQVFAWQSGLSGWIGRHAIVTVNNVVASRGAGIRAAERQQIRQICQQSINEVTPKERSEGTSSSFLTESTGTGSLVIVPGGAATSGVIHMSAGTITSGTLSTGATWNVHPPKPKSNQRQR